MKRHVIRRLVPTAIALLLLIVPAAVPIAASEPIREARDAVLDPFLLDLMGQTPSDERMEVIVQFEGEVRPGDLDALRCAGLEVVHEFHIVPAVYSIGTPDQVWGMTAYDRTTWIEHNERLELLMDETTVVVNATDTWRSRIAGTIWGDLGVDGRGITVVVVDSGIDAGHPDLDYGTKTIRNLKSDTGYGPWYEIENGDTSSGHGTHVAGTVAGNGDASAGSRAGVAPGANLIGLSVGEGNLITGAVGAFEWVYENSRPGNNPYNIRVVSNSWGAGGGQYNPQDAVSEAINKLVYDNNLAVVFAAGNSGGSGDDVQASNYGNTPAAICVAASGRDGSYITSFSSKGRWNWVDSWPDVAAPGHNIESTAARRTQISVSSKDPDANPYYLAISGTSMATPHVSGTAALLLQAAPSLRVADMREDVGVVVKEDGVYSVEPPEDGSYGDLPYIYEDWMASAGDTRIHEVELILKLTSDLIPPQGVGDPELNGLSDNQVPDWNVDGVGGRSHDFSQGYGLINVHRAVGLALTVERIRADHPEATVMDAYTVFEDVFEEREVREDTDRLVASWEGEWSRFNDQLGKRFFTSNQTKYVYVPEGTQEVTATVAFPLLDTTELIAGTLGFQIDWDNDGTWDYTSSTRPVLDGVRTETVAVSSNAGQHWKFGVLGIGIKFPRILQAKQFQEARIEYAMTVLLQFDSTAGTIVLPEGDPHAIVADLRFAPPSELHIEGDISMVRHVYDLEAINWSPHAEPLPEPDEGGAALWGLGFLLALFTIGFLTVRAWPESPPGRLLRRVGRAAGIDYLIGSVRGRLRRGDGGG